MGGTAADEGGQTRVDAAKEAPRWPERIVELGTRWRHAPDDRARDRILEELWPITILALERSLRTCSRRFGALPQEELADIASQKALDLLGDLDRQSWNPGASTPAQVHAFLANVARNGYVDRMRARGREVSLSETTEPLEAAPHGSSLDATPGDAAEHARAIAACAAGLTARARVVWFLRVFYELSSADIARHPRVGVSSPAVDAMLLRCRKHMRACMSERGFDPGRVPPGTFTILWEAVAPGLLG